MARARLPRAWPCAAGIGSRRDERQSREVAGQGCVTRCRGEYKENNATLARSKVSNLRLLFIEFGCKCVSPYSSQRYFPRSYLSIETEPRTVRGVLHCSLDTLFVGEASDRFTLLSIGAG